VRIHAVCVVDRALPRGNTLHPALTCS
jgi:hypothetical protein